MAAWLLDNLPFFVALLAFLLAILALAGVVLVCLWRLTKWGA